MKTNAKHIKLDWTTAENHGKMQNLLNNNWTPMEKCWNSLDTCL